MPQTYLYPTPIELTEIDQVKLPASMEGDILLDPSRGILPARNKDSHIVMWEQMDNYAGLMAPRGMGGEPSRVAPVGSKQYLMTPGVYGEFIPVEEIELTSRRRIGSVNETIDASDLVLRRGELLLDRQNSRLKKIGWDLLVYGAFSSTNALGAIVHTDSYRQRIYTAVVPLTTTATATPLQDSRNVKLLARGYSVDFGAGATEYMNQTTFNALIANTNQADLGGKRTGGLANVLGLADVNNLYAQEDLPKIQIVEDGYEDDSAGHPFYLYLPDGFSLVVGKRARNAPIGQFSMTRNATNPGSAPGPYLWVNEKMRPPHQIEVHRGFNGGTELYFPSALVLKKNF